MSLFKLDSKIYGAWLVEKGGNASINCHCSMLADESEIEPMEMSADWKSPARPLKKKTAAQLELSEQK